MSKLVEGPYEVSKCERENKDWIEISGRRHLGFAKVVVRMEGEETDNEKLINTSNVLAASWDMFKAIENDILNGNCRSQSLLDAYVKARGGK